MISVFAPTRALFLTLFSVIAIKLAGANMVVILPMIFFFLGFSGLSSCSLVDIDRLYHPSKGLLSGKLSVLDSFRISIIFLLFSIIAALFSNVLIPIVALCLIGLSSASVRLNHTFLSVFLEAFTFFFAMMVPSFTTGQFAYNFPMAWVVGVSFLLMNFSNALERPYGFENLNLPKIVGVENTKYLFLMVAFLVIMWGLAPIVFMSFAYSLIYPFSMSAMVTSVYLTMTDRHREAQKMIQVSIVLYFFALLFLI